MAELVDALASGASDRKVVEVQVLFWAPSPCWVVENNASTILVCELRKLVFEFLPILGILIPKMGIFKSFIVKCLNKELPNKFRNQWGRID